MELVLTASVTVILVTILSWMENKTAYGQQKPWKRQLVAGILLGISACIASDYGTNINGAICNVRDAAPLSAGLMFGPNAGVIAGLIGGIYRFFWGAPIQQVFSAEWLSVMFLPTSPGGFTRLACTFGTIAAGIFGALAREYLFEDKRPSWLGSCALGITIEIFHMILVFVFRLDAMQQGYVILRQVIVPMVLGNGFTVMVAALLCAWISGDQVFPSLRGKNLTTAFRNGLLACILSAFVVTTFGMYIMQKRLGLRQTEASLSRNLSDLKRKIEDDGGIESFIENDFTWHIGSDGGIIVCDVVNNPQGEMDYMRVVLNGKQYNKNQIIDIEQMNRQQVDKMPENFFESSLPIDGENVPVYGMYEYIDGYIVITYVPIEEATIFQNVTWLLTVCFDILLFASIFINIFVLIRRLILRNIDKINEKLSEITSGNLDTVVDVQSHNEFELLSKDINETVARLKQYIQEAEERIDQELEFARTIQHSALPSVFPAYPNRHDFDIFASMDPAKEVGGDFYDFYPTGKHKMVFLVADVSGKGIPAAMFMMTAKTFLKSYAELGSSPDKVLDITNEKLCETNEAGMFVTCFMCEADLKTGKVHFANAGHNPPLLYHRGEGFRYLKPKRGFVLAGMEGIRYHDQEFDMAPGDYVFLYTDGVT
ncbi:MAG: SpoIIE family protein phosphatase, partial [Erysipelotrichaceae bacterium]|nr:SpoIIE family protein phosphatase [Erysipelotrichaceae bacterium]